MTAEPPDSRDYELLVQRLIRDLSRNAQVYTTGLAHDIPIQGRSTTNRIDVVWDFTDASDQTRRVVFECRSYKSAIKQQALHSWRSVVDDIQSDERPVVGVMVTTVGYQVGARRVADTYDLLVLELRQPTEADLANRMSAIRVQLNVQPTVVDDMRLEIEDGYDDRRGPPAIYGYRSPFAPSPRPVRVGTSKKCSSTARRGLSRHRWVRIQLGGSLTRRWNCA